VYFFFKSAFPEAKHCNRGNSSQLFLPLIIFHADKHFLLNTTKL